jgi:predicted PurR-regulated permease PerM
MTQATTPSQATPTGDAPRRDWRRERALAGFALIFVLLFTVPALVLPTLSLMTFIAMLMALTGLFVRRDRLRRKLRAVAVYFVLTVAASGLVAFNMHLAETRLQTLVDAVHAYQDANGAYPDDLDALIPTYVDHIPHATLWLTQNEFHWDKEGLLTCIPSPPLGWIGYDFKTESWGAMD